MYILRLAFICVTISRAKSHFNLGYSDTAKNAFQYLEEKNYRYENHTVVTEDGYKLLLVRIPQNCKDSACNKTGPPVLFVHGLATNFYDFLITGPGVAFGFEAQDKGYDVFLLNVRGNRWSRNHTILNPDKDSKFWDFCFHEIGKYDLTATIDYITKLTGSPDLSYVGHSRGATSFLTMASLKPEYNKKVKVAILIAPVVYLSHSSNLMVKIYKRHSHLIELLASIIPVNEVLSYNYAVSRVLRLICSPKSLLLPACKGVVATVTGHSTQTNNSMVSAYLTNSPSGATKKEMLHFIQIAHTDKFRQYNHGKKGNMADYGQPTPPYYDLSAVSAPIAMFYGADDYFSPVTDANKLVKSLPNVVANVLVPYRKTNHLDPVIGRNAKELFTDPSLNILNKYNDL